LEIFDSFIGVKYNQKQDSYKFHARDFMRSLVNAFRHLAFFLKVLVGLVITWAIVVMFILPAFVFVRGYLNASDSDVAPPAP